MLLQNIKRTKIKNTSTLVVIGNCVRRCSIGQNLDKMNEVQVKYFQVEKKLALIEL
jgi:hypothetical protein